MTAYSKRQQLGPPKVKAPKRLGESRGGREERLTWERERDEYRAAHPDCEFVDYLRVKGPRALAFSWPSDCGGRLDVHHIQPRGAGGKRGPTGPLASLCRVHHEWAENYRLEAKALGLLVKRQPWGGR